MHECIYRMCTHVDHPHTVKLPSPPLPSPPLPSLPPSLYSPPLPSPPLPSLPLPYLCMLLCLSHSVLQLVFLCIYRASQHDQSAPCTTSLVPPPLHEGRALRASCLYLRGKLSNGVISSLQISTDTLQSSKGLITFLDTAAGQVGECINCRP